MWFFMHEEADLPCQAMKTSELIIKNLSSM